MAFGIRSESISGGDDSWMGSRHGVDTAQTITLDASAFTDPIVRSGQPVQRDADGVLAVPFTTGPLAGFVIGDHDLSAGDAPVAYMWHGRVKVDRLPVEFTAPADAPAFTFVNVPDTTPEG